MRGSAALADVVVDRFALPEHQRQHGERPQRTSREGPAPRSGEPGHAQQHHRRDCPAKVAADTVHGERVAQTRLRYAVIEDREVDRMERRVAQPGEGCGQQQPAIALRHRTAGSRCNETAERREQHGPCADAIDQEPRQRLADAGDGKEECHQQTEFGVAQPEGLREHRKQRRQQHVKEVRGAMRQPDQRDRVQIASARSRLDRSDGGAHAVMVTRVPVQARIVSGRDPRNRSVRIGPRGCVSAPCRGAPAVGFG